MSATEKSWWEQNWRWALPVGCLTSGCLGIVVLLGLLIAGGAGIVSMTNNWFKTSGPYRSYQLAVEKVKNDPTVTQQLGTPLSASWAQKIRYKVKNNTSVSCMSFSISGANKGANVYFEALESSQKWDFHRLIVNVDGVREPIILATPPSNNKGTLCPDSEFEKSPSPAPKVSP